MNAKLKQELADAFALSRDLFDHLDEANLLLDLPNHAFEPHGGAGVVHCGRPRELPARDPRVRLARLLLQSREPARKAAVLQRMAATSAELDALDFTGLGQTQIELAFALLRHEVQHHGQLIRYVYANGLTFPASWNARYTV
jgi:hypothetical protein